jgi:hypothetical protein
MAADWKSAYLKQGVSDYEIFLRLYGEKIPTCHKLHYLQMTAEKLAKGFLTLNGGPRYPNTHNAFKRFMIIARHSEEIMVAAGFTRKDQYQAYIGTLQHTAQRIEDLSPEGGDHPNPEYPWESAGVITVPMEYPFSDFNLKGKEMARLLQFIADCVAVARRRTV